MPFGGQRQRVGLARARNNAAKLLAARPDAQVRIIANGEAVAEALTNPDEGTDAVLVLIAELQAERWGYMQA